jgi:hypothetical protein
VLTETQSNAPHMSNDYELDFAALAASSQAGRPTGQPAPAKPPNHIYTYTVVARPTLVTPVTLAAVHRAYDASEHHP